MISGAKGGVLALANIIPNTLDTIYTNYKKDRILVAQQTQQYLTEVNDITTVKYGIGGLKYAFEQVGYLFIYF